MIAWLSRLIRRHPRVTVHGRGSVEDLAVLMRAAGYREAVIAKAVRADRTLGEERRDTLLGVHGAF
jgi:hypothetical protein